MVEKCRRWLFFFFWLCGRSLCPLSPAPSLIESEGPLTPQPVTPPQPSSAAGFLSKPFYLLPLAFLLWTGEVYSDRIGQIKFYNC